jgi:hypothetical protein
MVCLIPGDPSSQKMQRMAPCIASQDISLNPNKFPMDPCLPWVWFSAWASPLPPHWFDLPRSKLTFIWTVALWSIQTSQPVNYRELRPDAEPSDSGTDCCDFRLTSEVQLSYNVDSLACTVCGPCKSRAFPVEPQGTWQVWELSELGATWDSMVVSGAIQRSSQSGFTLLTAVGLAQACLGMLGLLLDLLGSNIYSLIH